MKAFGVDLPVLRIVFPQRVFFDTDKAELRPDAMPVIDLVAEDLRRDVPDVALFIAGHTDSRGSDTYNYTLSVARADAVARALYARGVGSARLWRVGFGKAVPVKPNTSARNMAENRRVEFLFAARPEAVAVWLSKQGDVVCDAVPPSERSACRQQLAALPAFTASPVLDAKRTSISPDVKSVAVPMGETTGSVDGGQHKTDLIGKNSTIILDLNEKKVTVGRPVF